MTDDEERKALAGDYVLGLLTTAERERAEARMAEDPVLRAMVGRLADHLLAIDDTAGSAPVPADLWPRIAADLGEPMSSLPVGGNPAAPINPAAARATRRQGSGSGWRPLALAASLAIACGLGFALGRLTQQAPTPDVVVVLLDDSANPGAIVEAYGDDRVRIVPLTEFEVPAGKTLEVWTLYDKAVGPVSLGTFTDPREVVLTGPDLPRPAPDQLYEITLEDAPRSPVGRPTGPILVKGFAKRPAGL